MNDSPLSTFDQYAEHLLLGTGIAPGDARTIAMDQSAGDRSSPVAATLRDGWATAHGMPRSGGAMTGNVEWFDLGQRLAAEDSGAPVRRLLHAPVPALIDPIAIRARRVQDSITVTTATGIGDLQTASGSEALDLLHSLDVRITADTWRTLVTDDHATLPLLLKLARSAGKDGAHAATAAHIAWWADRQDFPGTSAHVPLLTACPARWITGSTPHAETQAATWRRWMSVEGDEAATMLPILHRLTAEASLPGLDDIRTDDGFSWQFAHTDHADGRDWRTPDTVGRAATGLRARCDVAELYAAALLADPLFRRRAVHTGHVVTGCVSVDGTDSRGRTMRITCDRLDARLRAGDAVIGWAGEPDSEIRARWSGTITSATVADGNLVFDLTVVAAQRPVHGASVSVVSAPPNAKAMANGRKRYRSLYGNREWLTTGRRPTFARRDVPLDVLFASTH